MMENEWVSGFLRESGWNMTFLMVILKVNSTWGNIFGNSYERLSGAKERAGTNAESKNVKKKFPVPVVVLYVIIKEIEVMDLRENNGKGGKGKGNMI